MKLTTPSNHQVPVHPLQRLNPRFAHRPTIVNDDFPIQDEGVPQKVHLRVGVPKDEEKPSHSIMKGIKDLIEKLM
jgi:hypothetical protein